MLVSDYQKIYDINESADIDAIEKMAWTICFIFGYSEKRVDKMSQRRFSHKMLKAEKHISRALAKRLYDRRPNTDATKITFGQFVEVAHWVKGGKIESMHLIYASMLNTGDHKAAAAAALKMNVRAVLPYVAEFMQSFDKLIGSYKNLFESDSAPDEKPEPPHPFIERFGWIYSATQIAEHNKVSLNDAFRFNVVQALNDLSFLKSKAAYEKHMTNG